MAFVLLTFLHIATAELVPRFVAIRHPEKSALFVARPLRFYRHVMEVPQAILNGAARGVLRLLGVPMSSETEVTYTEEELRSILGASQERGGFSFHHLLLLENAFDFGELRIKDVMVPLPLTVALDATRPWSENAAVIAEKRLSRYPLRDGPNGKFLGLVHAKTILIDLLSGRTPDLRRDALKLPRASQELLLEAALRKLQKSGEHMGIAIDEQGREIGMFTLEDIVEELIGDIRDEFEASRDVSIADLMRPETVLLDPLVVDHHELIAMLVRMACDGVEGVDPAVAIEAVERRDKQVPFSVGGSVAVPHARVPGLKTSRGRVRAAARRPRVPRARRAARAPVLPGPVAGGCGAGHPGPLPSARRRADGQRLPPHSAARRDVGRGGPRDRARGRDVRVGVRRAARTAARGLSAPRCGRRCAPPRRRGPTLRLGVPRRWP